MNQYPIALSHGIARFDYLTDSFMRRTNLRLWEWRRDLDRLHYFKGISEHLQQHGFEVYKTGVSFAASVEQRSRELGEQVKEILDKSGQEKVHMIGHSMGGLDARHMIIDEGMAKHVASLTSIGTPHLGTYFADWGLEHGGDEAIEALRRVIDLEGFLTLTRAERENFNERARHQEATNSVVYQTYTAVQDREQVFGLLRLPWQIIFDEEGENDGLVPARSQAWTAEIVSDAGEVKAVHQYRFPFAADHLNQIAWWDLDELRRAGWWRLSIFREKRRYEAAVRDVYLQIARNVSAIA